MYDIRALFGFPGTKNHAAVILHIALGTTRSERIAEATGIAQRSVQAILDRLRALKLVELEDYWTASGRESTWTPSNHKVWQSCLMPDALALLLGPRERGTEVVRKVGLSRAARVILSDQGTDPVSTF